jgi:hypothetical protein
VQVSIDQVGLFAEVDPTSKFVPAQITGRVHLSGDKGQSLHLAIAINGTIQGVTRPWTFPVKGQPGRWSAIVDETAFRAGQNDIEIFIVSTSGGKLILERTAASRTYFTLSS